MASPRLLTILATIRPASRRGLTVAVLATALLLAGTLGFLAAPRPANATIGCPNCATIYVDLSGAGGGTVSDGAGNTCVARDVTYDQCTFAYQWSHLTPSLTVTLTATAAPDSVACNTQSSTTCAEYGTTATQQVTLENGWSPSQSFRFDLARSAWVRIDLTGNGAGFIVEPGVTCTYSGVPSSCDHEYFWDPTVTTYIVDINVSADPGSGICGKTCATTLQALALTSTLVDGDAPTLALEFTTLATAPPATARPSKRPATSPAPTTGSPGGSVPPAASPSLDDAAAATPQAASSNGPDAGTAAAPQSSSTIPIGIVALIAVLAALVGGLGAGLVLALRRRT